MSPATLCLREVLGEIDERLDLGIAAEGDDASVDRPNVPPTFAGGSVLGEGEEGADEVGVRHWGRDEERRAALRHREGVRE